MGVVGSVLRRKKAFGDVALGLDGEEAETATESEVFLVTGDVKILAEGAVESLFTLFDSRCCL